MSLYENNCPKSYSSTYGSEQDDLESGYESTFNNSSNYENIHQQSVDRGNKTIKQRVDDENYSIESYGRSNYTSSHSVISNYDAQSQPSLNESYSDDDLSGSLKNSSTKRNDGYEGDFDETTSAPIITLSTYNNMTTVIDDLSSNYNPSYSNLNNTKDTKKNNNKRESYSNSSTKLSKKTLNNRSYKYMSSDTKKRQKQDEIISSYDKSNNVDESYDSMAYDGSPASSGDSYTNSSSTPRSASAKRSPRHATPSKNNLLSVYTARNLDDLTDDESEADIRYSNSDNDNDTNSYRSNSYSNFPYERSESSEDEDEFASPFTWYKEFQSIVDKPDDATKFKELSNLYSTFVHFAELFGKIIISEAYLPDEMKTLKPLQMGGVAGGEKYIVQGILFKFALDVKLSNTKWVYGGDDPNDEKAMKSACNELKGLESFASCGVHGLYFPLFALIYYRGFVLVAMCVLPISKSTIKYGSADAGRTVHFDDPVLNKKMEEAGSTLCLRKHCVLDKRMRFPGDIEGHIGSDGKCYVVDYGRMLPPEAPLKSGGGPQSIFYNLFRQTLVTKFKEKFNRELCSDAFSRWLTKDPDSREINNDAILATDFLHDQLIPEYAKILDEKANNGQMSEKKTFIANLHVYGLNIRHLGFVRSHSTNQIVRKYILTQAIARSIKNNIRQILRDTMKKCRVAGDGIYISETFEYLKSALFYAPQPLYFKSTSVDTNVSRKTGMIHGDVTKPSKLYSNVGIPSYQFEFYMEATIIKLYEYSKKDNFRPKDTQFTFGLEPLSHSSETDQFCFCIPDNLLYIGGKKKVLDKNNPIKQGDVIGIFKNSRKIVFTHNGTIIANVSNICRNPKPFVKIPPGGIIQYNFGTRPLTYKRNYSLIEGWEGAEKFWCSPDGVKKEILKRYPGCFNDTEMSDYFDILEITDREWLLDLIQEMIGLKLSPRVYEFANKEFFKLNLMDVVGFEPRSASISLLDLATAANTTLQLEYTSGFPEQEIQNLTLARDRLHPLYKMYKDINPQYGYYYSHVLWQMSKRYSDSKHSVILEKKKLLTKAAKTLIKTIRKHYVNPTTITSSLSISDSSSEDQRKKHIKRDNVRRELYQLAFCVIAELNLQEPTFIEEFSDCLPDEEPEFLITMFYDSIPKVELKRGVYFILKILVKKLKDNQFFDSVPIIISQHAFYLRICNINSWDDYDNIDVFNDQHPNKYNWKIATEDVNLLYDLIEKFSSENFKELSKSILSSFLNGMESIEFGILLHVGRKIPALLQLIGDILNTSHAKLIHLSSILGDPFNLFMKAFDKVKPFIPQGTIEVIESLHSLILDYELPFIVNSPNLSKMKNDSNLHFTVAFVNLDPKRNPFLEFLFESSPIGQCDNIDPSTLREIVIPSRTEYGSFNIVFDLPDIYQSDPFESAYWGTTVPDLVIIVFDRTPVEKLTPGLRKFLAGSYYPGLEVLYLEMVDYSTEEVEKQVSCVLEPSFLKPSEIKHMAAISKQSPDFTITMLSTKAHSSNTWSIPKLVSEIYNSTSPFTPEECRDKIKPFDVKNNNAQLLFQLCVEAYTNSLNTSGERVTDKNGDIIRMDFTKKSRMFSKLDHILQKNPTIETLHFSLSHEPFIHRDIKFWQSLGRGLTTPFCKVSKLTIHSCQLGNPPSELFFEYLAKCTTLTSIAFDGNSLHSKRGHVFARALQHLTQLKELTLSYCRIDDEAMKHIWNSISKLQSLELLDLSDNKFTEVGLEGIAHVTSFKTLFIRCVEFSEKGGDSIAKMIERSPNLSLLNLCVCRLGESASHLIHALPFGQALTDLNLDGNNLLPIFPAFCKSLIKLKNLERLSLMVNGLDEDSGPGLYELILTTKTLKNFNLSGNNLKSSVLYLVPAILFNYSLENLYLATNFVPEIISTVFIEYLKKRPKHLTIEIDYITTSLKEDDLKPFVKFVEETIQSLGNQISEAERSELNSTQLNTQFKTLGEVSFDLVIDHYKIPDAPLLLDEYRITEIQNPNYIPRDVSKTYLAVSPSQIQPEIPDAPPLASFPSGTLSDRVSSSPTISVDPVVPTAPPLLYTPTILKNTPLESFLNPSGTEEERNNSSSIPQAPPLNSSIPQAPPLSSSPIPQAPPLSSSIPQAPPLSPSIPQVPRLSPSIPQAPPLSSIILPPLSPSIPQAPPLSSSIPQAPPYHQ
eukprot:TRINITY_DN2496_c0_g1_i1.p1 TRINITY_DN2496_c0_g1~~TRINITY_DN2496_c0_g1_i1.p1  ORF type:complete len:2166 (+),score=385.55 TRINITY_DN2496_c0_g1_i1:51-6548(+)